MSLSQPGCPGPEIPDLGPPSQVNSTNEIFSKLDADSESEQNLVAVEVPGPVKPDLGIPKQVTDNNTQSQNLNLSLSLHDIDDESVIAAGGVDDSMSLTEADILGETQKESMLGLNLDLDGLLTKSISKDPDSDLNDSKEVVPKTKDEIEVNQDTNGIKEIQAAAQTQPQAETDGNALINEPLTIIKSEIQSDQPQNVNELDRNESKPVSHDRTESQTTTNGLTQCQDLSSSSSSNCENIVIDNDHQSNTPQNQNQVDNLNYPESQQIEPDADQIQQQAQTVDNDSDKIEPVTAINIMITDPPSKPSSLSNSKIQSPKNEVQNVNADSNHNDIDIQTPPDVNLNESEDQLVQQQAQEVQQVQKVQKEELEEEEEKLVSPQDVGPVTTGQSRLSEEHAAKIRERIGKSIEARAKMIKHKKESMQNQKSQSQQSVSQQNTKSARGTGLVMGNHGTSARGIVSNSNGSSQAACQKKTVASRQGLMKNGSKTKLNHNGNHSTVQTSDSLIGSSSNSTSSSSATTSATQAQGQQGPGFQPKRSTSTKRTKTIQNSSNMTNQIQNLVPGFTAPHSLECTPGCTNMTLSETVPYLTTPDTQNLVKTIDIHRSVFKNGDNNKFNQYSNSASISIENTPNQNQNLSNLDPNPTGRDGQSNTNHNYNSNTNLENFTHAPILGTRRKNNNTLSNASGQPPPPSISSIVPHLNLKNVGNGGPRSLSTTNNISQIQQQSQYGNTLDRPTAASRARRSPRKKAAPHTHLAAHSGELRYQKGQSGNMSMSLSASRQNLGNSMKRNQHQNQNQMNQNHNHNMSQAAAQAQSQIQAQQAHQMQLQQQQQLHLQQLQQQQLHLQQQLAQQQQQQLQQYHNSMNVSHLNNFSVTELPDTSDVYPPLENQSYRINNSYNNIDLNFQNQNNNVVNLNMNSNQNNQNLNNSKSVSSSSSSLSQPRSGKIQNNSANQSQTQRQQQLDYEKRLDMYATEIQSLHEKIDAIASTSIKETQVQTQQQGNGPSSTSLSNNDILNVVNLDDSPPLPENEIHPGPGSTKSISSTGPTKFHNNNVNNDVNLNDIKDNQLQQIDNLNDNNDNLMSPLASWRPPSQSMSKNDKTQTNYHIEYPRSSPAKDETPIYPPQDANYQQDQCSQIREEGQENQNSLNHGSNTNGTVGGNSKSHSLSYRNLSVQQQNSVSIKAPSEHGSTAGGNNSLSVAKQQQKNATTMLSATSSTNSNAISQQQTISHHNESNHNVANLNVNDTAVTTTKFNNYTVHGNAQSNNPNHSSASSKESSTSYSNSVKNRNNNIRAATTHGTPSVPGPGINQQGANNNINTNGTNNTNQNLKKKPTMLRQPAHHHVSAKIGPTQTSHSAVNSTSASYAQLPGVTGDISSNVNVTSMSRDPAHYQDSISRLHAGVKTSGSTVRKDRNCSSQSTRTAGPQAQAANQKQLSQQNSNLDNHTSNLSNLNNSKNTSESNSNNDPAGAKLQKMLDDMRLQQQQQDHHDHQNHNDNLQPLNGPSPVFTALTGPSPAVSSTLYGPESGPTPLNNYNHHLGNNYNTSNLNLLRQQDNLNIPRSTKIMNQNNNNNSSIITQSQTGASVSVTNQQNNSELQQQTNQLAQFPPPSTSSSSSITAPRGGTGPGPTQTTTVSGFRRNMSMGTLSIGSHITMASTVSGNGGTGGPGTNGYSGQGSMSQQSQQSQQCGTTVGTGNSTATSTIQNQNNSVGGVSQSVTNNINNNTTNNFLAKTRGVQMKPFQFFTNTVTNMQNNVANANVSGNLASLMSSTNQAQSNHNSGSTNVPKVTTSIQQPSYSTNHNVTTQQQSFHNTNKSNYTTFNRSSSVSELPFCSATGLPAQRFCSPTLLGAAVHRQQMQQSTGVTVPQFAHQGQKLATVTNTANTSNQNVKPQHIKTLNNSSSTLLLGHHTRTSRQVTSYVVGSSSSSAKSGPHGGQSYQRASSFDAFDFAQAKAQADSTAQIQQLQQKQQVNNSNTNITNAVQIQNQQQQQNHQNRNFNQNTNTVTGQGGPSRTTGNTNHNSQKSNTVSTKFTKNKFQPPSRGAARDSARGMAKDNMKKPTSTTRTTAGTTGVTPMSNQGGNTNTTFNIDMATQTTPNIKDKDLYNQYGQNQYQQDFNNSNQASTSQQHQQMTNSNTNNTVSLGAVLAAHNNSNVHGRYSLRPTPSDNNTIGSSSTPSDNVGTGKNPVSQNVTMINQSQMTNTPSDEYVGGQNQIQNQIQSHSHSVSGIGVTSNNVTTVRAFNNNRFSNTSYTNSNTAGATTTTNRVTSNVLNRNTVNLNSNQNSTMSNTSNSNANTTRLLNLHPSFNNSSTTFGSTNHNSQHQNLSTRTRPQPGVTFMSHVPQVSNPIIQTSASHVPPLKPSFRVGPNSSGNLTQCFGMRNR